MAKKFQTEAELCDLLTRIARAMHFRVFPETAGFDLLLVSTEETRGFEDGITIGVEAKLHANCVVLSQAMPRVRGDKVHYYAVLVPKIVAGFTEVAAGLKITVIDAERLENPYYRDFSFMRWYRHEPDKPCWVPELEVPGMSGGKSAPQKLTKWKLGAVGLCLLAEQRGYLTKADFEQAGVSMGRFVVEKWILRKEVVKVGTKREFRYILNLTTNPPHLQYPEVYIALRDAKEKEAKACL